MLAAHQAVLAGADAGAGERGDLGAVLSTVVSNLHDYFIHVAARLEGLHDQVGGGGADPGAWQGCATARQPGAWGGGVVGLPGPAGGGDGQPPPRARPSTLQVQRSKAAHLAQLRAEGDYTDPFERARKLQVCSSPLQPCRGWRQRGAHLAAAHGCAVRLAA